VLLDVSMPGARGLEVLRDLRTAASGTRTVVLTSALDRAEALNVLRLGAQGLILRSAPAELICKCIRRVHCGEWWFSRELIAAAVESLPPTAAEEPRPTSPQIRLTRREREITRYIVGGDTNQAIARRLSVGEDTVKHHLTSIFQKTGVSTRVELALFAIQHGLVKT
jgi:DNA-binding NarL/FixJ family response regulator